MPTRTNDKAPAVADAPKDTSVEEALRKMCRGLARIVDYDAADDSVIIKVADKWAESIAPTIKKALNNMK